MPEKDVDQFLAEIAFRIKDEQFPDWVKMEMFDRETGLLLNTQQLNVLVNFDEVTDGKWNKFPRADANLPSDEDGYLKLDSYVDESIMLAPNSREKKLQLKAIEDVITESDRPEHSIIKTSTGQIIALFHSPDLEHTILGSGGFSSVRLGQNLQTKEIVAVKVLYSAQGAFDPVAIGEHEARMLGLKNLDHAVPNDPNSPQLGTVSRLDGQDNVKFYVLQAYAPGKELYDILFPQPNARGITPNIPSFSKRLSITTTLMKELSDSHANGVLNRDFKIENVRVHFSKNNPDIVSVVDAGSLQRLEGKSYLLSEKNADIVGTNRSIGPEVAIISNLEEQNNEVLDAIPNERSQYTTAGDVYAAGILISDMFFGEINIERTINTIPPILSINENVPPQHIPYLEKIVTLIQNCLEPDLEERPSAHTVFKELQALQLEMENLPDIDTEPTHTDSIGKILAHTEASVALTDHEKFSKILEDLNAELDDFMEKNYANIDDNDIVFACETSSILRFAIDEMLQDLSQSADPTTSLDLTLETLKITKRESLPLGPIIDDSIGKIERLKQEKTAVVNNKTGRPNNSPSY